MLLRSWGLSKAYKQSAISLESLNDAYIALYRPGGGHEIYQAVVPLGSVASVNNFVWCAFAAWTSGVRALKPRWSVYFDDYVCFAWESVANHTAMVVCALLAFMGFRLRMTRTVTSTRCALFWVWKLALALGPLRRHLDGARRVFKANEAARAALEWIRDRILPAPPRQPAAKEMPFRHIYVYARCDSSSDLKAGLGGI